MRKLIGGALAACLVLGAGVAAADEVGKVGVDWLGNDIIVEAIKDPKVEGVTCHVSYFDRGVIDFAEGHGSRIVRSSIPAAWPDHHRRHRMSEAGGKCSSKASPDSRACRTASTTRPTTLIYCRIRAVQNGSAKMSVTTVPLYGQNVVWTNGKPK